MPFAAAQAWLLFAMLLGLGEAGHLHPGLGAALATLAAAGYFVVLVPRAGRPPLVRLAGGAALLVAAALLARAGEGGVIAALALVAAAAAVLGGSHPRAAVARTHLLALALFALFWPLYREGGAAWFGLERLAGAYARAVGHMVGESYFLSATAIALPGFVLAALLVVARAALAEGRAWAWAARALGILLLAHGLGLASLEPIAMAVQRWVAALDFFLFNPQPVVAGFLAAGLALAGRWAPAPAARLGPALAPLGPAFRARAGLVLAAVAGAAGWAFALGWSPPARPAAGEVLLFDRGFLDWRVPQFGRYGQRSSGMFGLLPRVLGSWGWPATISPDSLVERHLERFRCVVLINVNTSFAPRELEDLRRYVERGGSLLVLGDHTGVAGVRGPFNELLRPFGIAFRFDSATFPGNSWEYAHAPLPHPLRAALVHDDEPQIWVGASLESRPPARPVLLARYGYSDWGEPAEYERSYLGDRRFNPGEQLGDLVLVAERRYGLGRVLVFGDTSPFQNGALVKSQRFVARVFRYLIASPGRDPGPLPFVAALACLLLVPAGVGRPRAASLAGLLAVPLGVALGAALAPALNAREAPPWPQAPVALIDRSHLGRFDALSWYDESVGGLEYNLLRNGYLPRTVERDLVAELARAELLFVIAPARRFGTGELAAVERFVRRGGWLIHTVGHEERDGSLPLLARFGFDVAASPLTQFDADVGGRLVRFDEAWPVRLPPAGAEVVVTHFGEPVIARRRIEDGGVVVIGDSNFLLNRNLESENGAFEGNVLFLRDLLGALRGGGSPR